MKVFLCLFVCLAAAAASDDSKFLKREFEIFVKEHNKVYASAGEKAKRFAIFKDNVRKIQEHNLSGASWTSGITKFADMTQSEFQSTLNGYVNMKKPDLPVKKTTKKIDPKQLPAEVDWSVYSDVMSPVKDQGSCGSCWAFAGVQMIESYAGMNNGSITELSAQQMTSCTPNELRCGGTGGCYGSIPQLGWTYTQLFGITTEAAYPYQSGSQGQLDCQYSPDVFAPAAYVRGWEVLPRNDYMAVMDHIANVGPLSVAVDASVWGLYRGGIFDACPYDQNIAINHAVQLVGYGTDANGQAYWKIRNSWGPGWGEDGYIRIVRETESLECGTDSTPLTGTACVNDGNDSQNVCGMCAVLFDVSYPIGAYYL